MRKERPEAGRLKEMCMLVSDMLLKLAYSDEIKRRSDSPKIKPSTKGPKVTTERLVKYTKNDDSSGDE